MDFNPYMNLNFLDLLQSQQDTSINLESSHVPLFGSQETEASNFKPDSHAETRGKKQVGDGKELDEFQKMWRIKQEDLVIKEKLSKMKLLDRIMAKQEPLDADEEALKKKLINELLLCN
ncbi:hypothetical protein Bca52824_040493 [Brassica carinata]|uniref:Uncharacterized protein n=1 Tax=Brassica carinata TaxID=52824 RepID=A0A8X7RRD3_BRACI|nr:hypothetical protein Bca52824_040493 [Brassica carinata]